MKGKGKRKKVQIMAKVRKEGNRDKPVGKEKGSDWKMEVGSS